MNEADFKSYRIIYENAEDFDIQKWVDWKSLVKSRHQAKAHKDANTIFRYRKVLNIQKKEMKRKENWAWGQAISQAWFQIWIFEDSLYEGECNNITIEIDEENSYLHDIAEITNFVWKNWNIAKCADPCSYKNNPNNIKLYEYNFSEWLQKYCPMDDNIIVKESQKLIAELKSCSAEGVKNIYWYILFTLDNKIHETHLRWENHYPIVAFKEIMQKTKYITIKKFWKKFLYEKNKLKNFSKKNPKVGFLKTFENELSALTFWTVEFTNNRTLTSLSFRRGLRMSLRVTKLICCTSLKKWLLVAKNKFFVCFTFFLDRIADHKTNKKLNTPEFYQKILFCQIFFRDYCNKSYL